MNGIRRRLITLLAAVFVVIASGCGGADPGPIAHPTDPSTVVFHVVDSEGGPPEFPGWPRLDRSSLYGDGRFIVADDPPIATATAVPALWSGRLSPEGIQRVSCGARDAGLLDLGADFGSSHLVEGGSTTFRFTFSMTPREASRWGRSLSRKRRTSRIFPPTSVADERRGGEGMKKWWLVGAVPGLVLLGACQSESDSARPVEDQPTVTVEEATMALEEASESASESVREAMEGVREAGDESIITIAADKFLDFTYEASDIAEFCEATDVLGEAVSYDLFLKGAGELIEDRRFEWPTPREVFDELMGRC